MNAYLQPRTPSWDERYTAMLRDHPRPSGWWCRTPSTWRWLLHRDVRAFVILEVVR